MSGFSEWNQLEYAKEWVLLEENMGEQLSIDESMHAKDLFTFLSNKEGHGKKGTLIAAVRGTKASEVAAILMKYLVSRPASQTRTISVEPIIEHNYPLIAASF